MTPIHQNGTLAAAGGVLKMELIFICPKTEAVFYSSNFEITHNRGIRTDAAGNKTLDAQVRVTEPCPFCGVKHAYHASELSCPFAEQQ